MIRAEAKCPGDAQFSSRIDEYLAARTANGNGCATRGALTPEEQERQNQLDNESGD